MHQYRCHEARSERADSLHFELPHRSIGFGFGDIVHGVTEVAKDVAGVGKGIVEGAVDTVTGIAEVVTHPVDAAKGIASLVTNPKESWPALWHGITNPIVQDWQNGNQGEAIGRVVWGVAEVILGSKGAAKIGKAGAITSHIDEVGEASKVAKAGEAASKIDEIADAGKAGKVGEAGEVLDDVPTPKPDAPEAPKPDAPKPDAPKPDAPGITPITPSDELLSKTFGTLSPDDAAFAKKLNVDHIFEGDQFGGRHVAPGPGKFGDVKVEELRHTPGRTWQANVSYRDGKGALQTKTTTMFPSEWTPTEVLQSIRRATDHAVDTGKTRTIGGREIKILEGEDRGLKLVIHQDAKTGEILSAHPKHVNKPFSENP